VNLIFSSFLLATELLLVHTSLESSRKREVFTVKITLLTNIEGGHFSGKCENLSLAGNYDSFC
jgi:hypothetical protein